MAYLYPLVLYTGLGSAVILLGLTSLARLRALGKAATAACLTLLCLLWLMLPQTGRWPLSVWSPGGVLGGHILLELSPPVWWLGLLITLALCGAAWIDVADRQAQPSLTGPLVLLALLGSWLALTSASLLTTLATWAILDLIWATTGILSGAHGERTIYGLALHGIASLVLWAVSLFLSQSGVSGLWWLMWPSQPMALLLWAAALMRVGFYPCHLVFPDSVRGARLLSLAHQLGPLAGVALLARLMALPGSPPVPDWAVAWGVFSVFWRGLMAWWGGKRPSLMGAVHTVLLIVVTGALATRAREALMAGVAVGFAASALVIYARGRDARAVAWSWPAWIGVLCFLGVPPSPIGNVYRALLASTPWIGRLLLIVGGAMASATFLRLLSKPAVGSASPPWLWRGLPRIAGSLVLVGTAWGAAAVLEPLAFSWLGLALWLLALLGATALAWWAVPVRRGVEHAQPVLEFLDLQWLYRSMWRGAENLLSVLRVSVDLVEGSGALLWSLLILLLILLVAGNQ